LAALNVTAEIPTGYGVESKAHKELVATFGQEFTWDFSDETELAKWLAQLQKPTTKRKTKRK
jgi:hypothetical protein